MIKKKDEGDEQIQRRALPLFPHMDRCRHHQQRRHATKLMVWKAQFNRPINKNTSATKYSDISALKSLK